MQASSQAGGEPADQEAQQNISPGNGGPPTPQGGSSRSSGNDGTDVRFPGEPTPDNGVSTSAATDARVGAGPTSSVGSGNSYTLSSGSGPSSLSLASGPLGRSNPSGTPLVIHGYARLT